MLYSTFFSECLVWENFVSILLFENDFWSDPYQTLYTIENEVIHFIHRCSV